MKIQINPSGEVTHLIANWLLVTIAAFLQWFTVENPLGIHWILYNLILAIIIRAIYLTISALEHLLAHISVVKFSGGILTFFLGFVVFLGLALLVPGLTVNTGYFFTVRAIFFGTVVILLNQSQISTTGSLRVTVGSDEEKDK